jgi:hypothetical protein
MPGILVSVGMGGTANQIDVSELPKGVYYVEVLSNQSKTTHKLFKN